MFDETQPVKMVGVEVAEPKVVVARVAKWLAMVVEPTLDLSSKFSKQVFNRCSISPRA